MIKNKIQKEYWFVIASAIFFGGIIFGGKILADVGLSMFEISVLPVALTALLLLPYMIFKRLLIPQKGTALLIIIAGIIEAITVTAQFAPLIMGVPVAVVVLLLYTQPIWTLLISKFFLKEKIVSIQIISCVLVLLGVLFLVNPLDINHATFAGVIVALIGGLGLTTWVVAGSVLSKKGNDPMNTFFWSMVIIAIFSLALLPLTKLIIDSPQFIHFSFIWPLRVWAYIFIFAITTKIISHTLYLYGVKKVPTADAGILMLLEPLSAAILAFIFLHQYLTINVIIGGALILIANYFVISKSSKQATS